MNKRVILFLLPFFLFASCVSKKKIIYLQKDEIDQENISNNYVTIFKPDDLLQITVIVEDVKSALPFNLPVAMISANSNTIVGQPAQIPYLVDSKGEIDFPILGKIKVGGLTREQTISLLKDKLDPKYIKNPKIYITITNFTINVNGDVRLPGTYTIPNERVTILDAISLAGDLNISARRDNILVIREVGNKKIEYRLDLTSKKIYTSPAFYLQQNDNIYVEPNYASIQSASSNSNTTLFISISGLLITIVSLIIR